MNIKSLFILLTALFSLSVIPGTALSSEPEIALSTGQTVYVPVYSNVFVGPRKKPFQLASMLAIRNTDMHSQMQVTAVDYYDNDGKLVHRYLVKPLVLGALASHDIYLEEKDIRGGFGANFIVKWKSKGPINIPVIECVMIGGSSQQGISFVSPGKAIEAPPVDTSGKSPPPL